jgi:hypothetical protein
MNKKNQSCDGRGERSAPCGVLISPKATGARSPPRARAAKTHQLLKYSAAAFCSELVSLPRNGSERHSESLSYFSLHGKEFRVVFSYAERFGTEFREFTSILVPRNGIPSCVLFRRRVRNRIMGVFFYFCSTERNSELLSLPRKGSERNSEIFCSAEQPEFRRK